MSETTSIKKAVLSGLFWKFEERITAQLVSLVVSIVLARLLTPDDYGAVALVMVFITIANVFVSNGLGGALVQKQEADDIDFSSVFYINIILSIVLYIFIFLSAPFIASFYGLEIMRPILRVLGLRIIVAAINSIQQAYISRHMLFKKFFLSTLFGTLVSGTIGIVMAFRGCGVWALVAQYLTNTTIDTIVLWFTVKWRPHLQYSHERARRLIAYGWKLLLAALLDTGYTQIRGLIIGKVYTSADLAFYNQGDKYPSVMCVNVNSSIAGVLFPAMSRFQLEPDRVKAMTRRSIQVSSFIMWPLMLGLAAISEPLIRVLLTDKWLPCVPYLRIFCLTYGLWPIHTSNLQAINAMGRSDLFLKMEIIKKIVGFTTLLISVSYGPFAIAFSLVITGVISTFINAFPNRKLLKYSYLEQLKDMFPSFIISAIMAVLVWGVSFWRIKDIYTIILQILVGMLVYVFLSYISRQSALEYLFSFLPRRKQ